jgi:hypothetical protein
VSRTLLVSAACACLLGPVACKSTSTYEVKALHHETVGEKLDAQWFQRDIYDRKGLLAAIEIVYCPIRPDATTVCRTAVVWLRNKSEIIDSEAR